MLKMHFIVHNESDAYNILDSIDDDLKLFNLMLTCYVDNIAYCIYYYDGFLNLDSYPFKIRVKKILQSFKYAIFSIYHTNFL